MKNILMILTGLAVFAVSCTDPELDPLRITDIKKGSLIALRGDAVDVLNDPANRGACDFFSISADPATESFHIEADFLAEDINSLSEVQVFAKDSDAGTRHRVGTVAGSAFTLTAGDGKYPRGEIHVELATILAALGKQSSDFAVNSYIYIECDLILADGSTVPASSFTNLSLYESLLFYPAHKLLYIAKP